MKGLVIGNNRLQCNIVDLFPGSPTTLEKWSLDSEWTYTHTRTHTHTHTHTNTHTHIHTTHTWVLINEKLRSYFLMCTLINANQRSFLFFNVSNILRIPLYAVLNALFLFKKYLTGVFFHWENKGKSKVLISTDLHQLLKIYWAAKLTIYNMHKSF